MSDALQGGRGVDVEDPGAIRDAGWRQGSIIVFEEASPKFKELLHDDGHRFTHWIVVSQDCDVVHHSYDAEPQVELLGCNLIEKPNGTFTAGKNPRKLHLPVLVTDGRRFAEARVCDRYCVHRSVLEAMAPSKTCSLDGDTVYTLADWIARRYIRSAFPDAFNERLRPKQKGFKKILVDHGEVLEGIYFSLNTFDELPNGQKYKLHVRLVMDVENYRDSAQLDKALRARDAFEFGLEKCDGIEVGSVEVLPADKFTLADMATYPAWDGFDYLSNPDSEV